MQAQRAEISQLKGGKDEGREGQHDATCDNPE